MPWDKQKTNDAKDAFLEATAKEMKISLGELLQRMQRTKEREAEAKLLKAMRAGKRGRPKKLVVVDEAREQVKALQRVADPDAFFEGMAKRIKEVRGLEKYSVKDLRADMAKRSASPKKKSLKKRSLKKKSSKGKVPKAVHYTKSWRFKTSRASKSRCAKGTSAADLRAAVDACGYDPKGLNKCELAHTLWSKKKCRKNYDFIKVSTKAQSPRSHSQVYMRSSRRRLRSRALVKKPLYRKSPKKVLRKSPVKKSSKKRVMAK